jgi:hypothetical protein
MEDRTRHNLFEELLADDTINLGGYWYESSDENDQNYNSKG